MTFNVSQAVAQETISTWPSEANTVPHLPVKHYNEECVRSSMLLSMCFADLPTWCQCTRSLIIHGGWHKKGEETVRARACMQVGGWVGVCMCVCVCVCGGQVPLEMNPTICDRNTSSHYVNCKGPPVQKPALWQGGIHSSSSRLSFQLGQLRLVLRANIGQIHLRAQC